MDTIQTQIVNGTVPYRLADANTGTPLGDAARGLADAGSRALTLGGARPATADR